MALNITELDEHVVFLREQADRLEKLADERKYRWATIQSKRMRKIAQMLLDIRRDQQMTTMSGQRIE